MTDLKTQIDWISRLVAYDTTSWKSNLPLIDDVESHLKQYGAETFRVPNEDGTKANLYAVLGPKVEGGVVLSGHTDVVPVEGQQWDTDPFTVVEKGGKLYGRGVTDMKSFCAVALSLVPEMAEAGLKRPVIFALSYDEEIGLLGAPHMIREIRDRLPAPSAVIVGEPTCMNVIDGHKGIASFRTSVTGYTTHSSQAERGVSAVEAAAKLVSKVVEMRERRAREADPDSPFNPPYTTMTVNVVRGGTQLNIMAGECVFEWDCRAVPGDSARAAREEFEDYARGVEAEMRARAPGCRIETIQLTDAPPLAPQADNPAADLAKALTGRNATDVVAYAAEAGQFQQAGFSTVICGPGSIDQAHQPNEFIAIAQVAEATAFLRKLIARLAA
ncbi:acetylornithine deacetylase [Amphiplicatus metriothermophilus]|uniref:Acetylornithine deacetylase n=1 Tax=Amphiplicatus metriothermophilus TaxID=1519374 RepID=A0A239PWD1_9PROT|nr:acetylornithine deacetylase [Amphiplicatus metriothermophilus]MBB5519694.1 acetylornithine deacetylase [Amphiplicatus metriothermophilus]SNT74256.1 acetylornithine deacetylase [Amphiplicatus metriothermophilus]